MKKVKLLAILLIIIYQFPIFANPDSLLQLYQTSPYDTVRIDVAHQLFIETFRNNLAKAESYNEFIVKRSAELNYGRGKMNGAYEKGILAYLTGKLPQAIQYYDQAYEYCAQTGEDPTRFTVAKASIYLVTGKLDTASQLFESAIERFEEKRDYYNGMVASNNLGVLYSNQGKYKRALGVYQKAKDYAAEIGDSSKIASFAINIGNSYFDLGKNADALENLLYAVEISEQAQDFRAQSIALNTIGEQYLETNQPKKALIYLEKSSTLKRKFELISSLGATLIFEGQAHLALKNYEQALEKLAEAIDLLEKVKEVKSLASAYFTKSEVLFVQNKWLKGLNNLKKAEETALAGQQKGLLSDIYLKYAEVINEQALDGLGTNRQDIATALDQAETYVQSTDNQKSMAAIYRAQSKFKGEEEDYKAAFGYNEKLQKITDSLYATEQVRALEDMRTKYETTQKEQENELLLAKNELINRRNQFYLGGLLAVLLLIFLLGFLYLKLRKTTRELAIQKEKVESQNIELKDLNQTKDRFFSIIAHDLRSPIAAFQGIGSQIDYFLKKKAFDRLADLGLAINESSIQLNNLLDNLLNWAMSQTGKIPYRPKSLLVVEQIEEAAALLYGVRQNKNIQFTVTADSKDLVYADERAVNTILRNLLNNALKFSQPRSTIWINTQQTAKYIAISIKDEGVGMTSEQVSQLFNVEKQSQEGTRGELGTGLGLVLVQELVTINHGKIEVESTLGEGSDFRVYLPAHGFKN